MKYYSRNGKLFFFFEETMLDFCIVEGFTKKQKLSAILMNTLRYYQEECIDAMQNTEKKFSIYQLFCGTGKTNIFTTYLEEEKLGVVVMAFPRISLVHQYNDDYYEKRDELRAHYKHYCVSSDHASKDELIEFAESTDGGRLILTTHTSFLEVCNLLLDADVEIDTIILDEIHHFGSKKKTDILEELDVERIFGFTATPANKFQQEKIEYQYGYSEALRDGYCKPFEVDLYVTEDEKNPENLYKGLFYLIEKTRVNNVLCFHAFSEVDGKNGKSSVSQCGAQCEAYHHSRTLRDFLSRLQVVSHKGSALHRKSFQEKRNSSPAQQLFFSTQSLKTRGRRKFMMLF